MLVELDGLDAAVLDADDAVAQRGDHRIVRDDDDRCVVGLAYVLKEDDFLGMKLGGEKPKCEKILYREFTSEEKKKEKEIAALMNSTVSKYENVKEKAEPFDFFNLPYKSICEKRKTR